MIGKYKLVYVEWVDSFGCSSTWEDISDSPKPFYVLCHSIGYLIFEDDKVKVIIPHLLTLTNNSEKFQGCGDMTIPNSAIRMIVEIDLKSSQILYPAQ